MFSLSWDFCNTQEQLKLSSNFFVVGRGGGLSKVKQGVLWEVLKWQIAE